VVHQNVRRGTCKSDNQQTGIHGLLHKGWPFSPYFLSICCQSLCANHHPQVKFNLFRCIQSPRKLLWLFQYALGFLAHCQQPHLRELTQPGRTSRISSFIPPLLFPSFSSSRPLPSFKYPISGVYDYPRSSAGIGPTVSSHILWLIHMVRRGTYTPLSEHRTGIHEPQPRRGSCPYFIAVDTY